MRAARLLAVAACLCLVTFQSAFAGAPLKGVDVKLGKNPGGGAAARMTDSNGNVDFGVWPKGDYTLSLSPAPGPSKMHVVIAGVANGAVERDIAASPSGRVAPIAFSLNGSTPLRVSVTSAGAGNPDNN
jgi:hypothetical protein